MLCDGAKFRMGCALRRCFALSSTTLSVFYAAMGIAVVLDALILRLPEAETLYSDLGVMPRSTLLGMHDNEGHTIPASLLLSTGSVAGVRCVLLLYATCGACLALGVYRRASALGAFAMCLSVHRRLYQVTNGGDAILRICLFWCCLLPAVPPRAPRGDQRRGEPSERSGSQGTCASSDNDSGSGRAAVISPATIALRLQLLIVIFTAGLHKTGKSWLDAPMPPSPVDIFSSSDGIDSDQCAAAVGPYTRTSAIYSTLGTADYTSAFGYWVRGVASEPLLYWVSAATVKWQMFVAPALVLSTGWLRLALLGSVWAFFAGIGTCMSLGLFPLVGALSFTIWLPSSLQGRSTTTNSTVSWESGPERGAAAVWLVVRRFIAAAALAVLLLHTFERLPPLCDVQSHLGRLLGHVPRSECTAAEFTPVLPPSVDSFIRSDLGLDQRWKLFAPEPPKCEWQPPWPPMGCFA